jgi:hypothetical protein
MQDRWKGAKLEKLLDGMTRTEFTLRLTLSHPAVTTVVGTRDPTTHLNANVTAAITMSLPATRLVEAKRQLDRVGGTPDGWPTRTPGADPP